MTVIMMCAHGRSLYTVLMEAPTKALMKSARKLRQHVTDRSINIKKHTLIIFSPLHQLAA